MTREDFLSTKFALWIDTRSSIDNSLHGNGRVVEKDKIFQIETASEASGGDLMCYVFRPEDTVAHLNVNDRDILTIEK